MRIEKITIHNFRSIRDLEIKCEPLVVLLGPNNHGKSNILAALDFFLTPGGKVDASDLFAFDTRTDDTVWVEVVFIELTDQEKKTFEKYVKGGDRLQVRKTAEFEGDKVSIRYQGWLEEPEEEWLKSENASNYTSHDEAEKTGLKDHIPAGKLSKAKIEEAQQAYIEAHREELQMTYSLESGNLLGGKGGSIGGGILPEFYLVPAVRHLSDETKIQNTALLGRLVKRAIKIMSEKDPAFTKIKQELKAQIDLLNEKDENNQPKIEQLREIKSGLEEELKVWDVKIDLEIDTPPIDRIFEMGTNLHLDDGIRTLAEKKGDGLQRALIIALIKTWAKLIRQEPGQEDEGNIKPRASSDSVYFAIEEPELFLHPQAQRELSGSLATLAEANGSQVFICTHSSHFVDMERYRSICLVSKPNPSEGSHVRQCVVDLFAGENNKAKKDRLNMAYWINPDRGEMFFARRVVFVEGATEKTVLPFLAKKLGIYDHEVSIIDCGSKHNLPLYMAIANAFSLEYVVIHDEDPIHDTIPEDWNKDKIKAKQDTFALNNTIQNALNGIRGKVLMQSPDFETMAEISKTQGEKKGKPIAALDHFESLDVSEIPPDIVELVKVVYNKQ